MSKKYKIEILLEEKEALDVNRIRDLLTGELKYLFWITDLYIRECVGEND